MVNQNDALAAADAAYVVQLFHTYALRAARAVFIFAVAFFLLWAQSHPGSWLMMSAAIAALSVTNVTKWASVVAITALLLLWMFPAILQVAKTV